jgi:glyoxylase-like metal-dependent hydrolase (beta-lactamase superfamily II)
MTGAGLVRSTSAGRYAVYAVQYGRRAGVRGEHFLGWDTASAQRHDTAYFAWLALSADRTLLIDSGIRPDAAVPVTGWEFREGVADILQPAGIDAGHIDTLLLTHLHYDHAGGMRTVPNARVIVQRNELAYWTGPDAHRISREEWLTNPDDIRHLQMRAASGSVDLVAGDVTVAAGVSVYLVGGHTAGMQIVRVQAEAQPVVIASDASHFFENLETGRPGTILHDMPGIFRGFDRAQELAAGGPVVPGHDPLVMERFEPVAGVPADRIVRIA